MKHLTLALVALSLVACNNAQEAKYDQKQTQVPITPKGTVVGRVLELGTATPLGGVSVALNVPGVAPATTSAEGTFAFADVVVTSELMLIFKKDGYLTSTTTAVVPGAVNYAGSTPLAGGIATARMELAKADGTIKGIVFLPNQRPAVNATVVVDQRRSYVTASGVSNLGESVVTAKTGMDGSFTLTGLASAPAGISHRVTAQWFDENGDMQADYGSVVQVVDVLGTDPSRVFLQYSDIGQRVIDSNVFDGEVGAMEGLTFTFAMPVLSSGQNTDIVNQVTLVNVTNNSSQVAVDQTWENNGTKVTAKAIGGALREGDQYRVSLNLKQTNGNFFSPSYLFQVRSATVTAPATQVANFTVTNPSRTPNTNFDHADTQFTLTFTAVAGFSSYNIYAKDTTTNLAFVFLQTYTPNIGAGRLTTVVNLPFQFNRNRPLSDGNKVTFAVVPIDRYGNTALLSAAPAVTVADNVQPRVTSTAPSRIGATAPDGINDTTVAATVQMRLSYTEPMDGASAPVYTNAGGAVVQSFVWEAGLNTGILTLNITAGGDITGPFTIRGGKDAAGNVLANADFTGILGGRKELLLNGNFEDAAGTCSITSWVASGTPAPVAVTNNNSTGTGRCGGMIGSPIGSSPVTGVTKLQQDVVLADITNGLGWSYEYGFSYRAEYATTGIAAAVNQRCRITDTADMNVVGLFSVNSSNMPNYVTPATGSLAPAQTVRFQCEVNNATTDSANAALFVDNVSIALVKPGTI